MIHAVVDTNKPPAGSEPSGSFLLVIHHLRDVAPGGNLAAHVGIHKALAYPQAERHHLKAPGASLV